jgi:hypothetical protein
MGEEMLFSVLGLCDCVILSSFMWLISQQLIPQEDSHYEIQDSIIVG